MRGDVGALNVRLWWRIYAFSDPTARVADTAYVDGPVWDVRLVFFFFQAEDGIRDIGVTGVQTCALPIFVLSAVKLPSFTGSSSHPTGTGAGAVLFRPPVMALLGTIVLLFQALLLAHGGLTTLGANAFSRSEEHTSELQSRQYLVCRLLLEKKKTELSASCP